MAEKKINLKLGLKGAKKTEKGLGKVDKSLRSLGKSAAAAGAAFFGARAIISGLKKAIELSAKMEGLSRGFNNLTKSAGFSAQAFSKLQKATDGTMSSMDLMKQANNAMLLGIFESDDQMAKMFDTAQRLAQALGKDAAFGIESLVTGMGRQSKLMLDNLGIMVKAEDAYKRYAAELHKSVSELTDMERKQAFVNEAMKEANKLVKNLGDEQLTTKDAMNAASASAEALGIAIGEKLAPVTRLVANDLKMIADNLTEMLVGTKEVALSNEELMMSYVKEFTALEKLTEEQEGRAISLDELLPLLFELRPIEDGLTHSYEEQKEALLDLMVEQLAQMEFAERFSDDLAPRVIDSWQEITVKTQNYTDKQIQIDKQNKHNAKSFDLLQSSVDLLADSFFKLETAGIRTGNVAKRAAQIQATVDTYAAANAAYKAMAGIPVVGPGLGVIAAAAAIAAGFENVKAIESAATGFEGIVNKPTMFLTGERGPETVQVTPHTPGMNQNGPQGNITLNISAPLVDETVIDTIIPAIEKAQRQNLA